MDKATKVAVEKYPHGTFGGELGDSLRAACAVGYMQAEKDLCHHSEKGKIGKNVITQEDVEETLLSLGIHGIDDLRLSDLVDLALIYYNKGATSSVDTNSKG